MNFILLQFWEESERGWGTRPDGASLHIDEKFCNEYVNNIYDKRDVNNIPDEYDRTIGVPVKISVTDEIYDNIKIKKNIRIPQYQLNNLIKLKDIIINDN